MTAETKPVVGKSFYAECKKCGTDRYHTVLALPTEATAKLKCEVCGSQKTWKAPKAPSARKPNTSGLVAARAARAKATETARASAHTAEYETLLKNAESNPPQSYTMKGKFEKDHKLNHPKFGLGVIRVAHPDKIEVVFVDEVRSLVHNRG